MNAAEGCEGPVRILGRDRPLAWIFKRKASSHGYLMASGQAHF